MKKNKNIEKKLLVIYDKNDFSEELFKQEIVNSIILEKNKTKNFDKWSTDYDIKTLKIIIYAMLVFCIILDIVVVAAWNEKIIKISFFLYESEQERYINLVSLLVLVFWPWVLILIPLTILIIYKIILFFKNNRINFGFSYSGFGANFNFRPKEILKFVDMQVEIEEYWLLILHNFWSYLKKKIKVNKLILNIFLKNEIFKKKVSEFLYFYKKILEIESISIEWSITTINFNSKVYEENISKYPSSMKGNKTK